MNVCFLSHDSELNGAERALLELIAGLRQKGVGCFVILRRPGPIIRRLEQAGIPYAIIPFNWWVQTGSWRRAVRGGLANFKRVGPIAEQLDRWKIDVVCTNSAAAPPIAAVAARLKGLPHFWFLHEFVRKEHGIAFPFGIQLSCKIMSGLSRNVLVCSKALEDYYAQYINRKRLRVVDQAAQSVGHTSIQEKRLIATTARVPKLLLVGFMHEGKRQLDAIQAMGFLAGAGVHAELFLVGGSIPAYLQQLQAATAQEGVESAVHFCGPVENADALMEDADIVLSCSMWEAFPRVTVEAMRAGKPLVAARHAGTAELVRDGFNGLLYTPGDSIDLAAKIRQLIDDPALARRLGENGRDWAKARFSVEKFAGQVLAILSEIAGS